MIRLDDVWKLFDGKAALRGVSLTVAEGDALLLSGPSGAGKTTLLRLLFAAEEADRGELYVAGRSLRSLRRASIPYVRRNIGFVFQDFKLLGEATALENVVLPLEILGLGRREVTERARAALAAVGLAEHAQIPAARLSGGEQQRVSVARALASQPSVLLCDEPTGNLDPDCASQLLELLETVHRQGTTVVLATHDPEVVEFGVVCGWRRALLIAGELLDADPRLGRQASLDGESEGPSSRSDGDGTKMLQTRRSHLG